MYNLISNHGAFDTTQMQVMVPVITFKVVWTQGGHSPWKVVRVWPAVKNPFPRLSCRSLDPQLQHDPVF